MDKKIIGIFICTLLIFALFPVSGNLINEKDNNYKILTKINKLDVEITTLEKSRKIAYAEDAYPGYNMVSFNLASPGTFTVLGPYVGPNFVVGGAWANDNWYVIDYTSPALYKVNTTTGSMILIGGSGTAYNDISFDITTNTLYGASSYNLYKINIGTGSQTLVGSWGSNFLMIDIAIDNNGVIYGHDIISDSIYIIDKETCEVTYFCPSICAGKMEYDHDNNILYVYGNGSLYTYNLTNGDCIFIGYFQGNAEIEGLAIPYTNSPPEAPTINGPVIGDPGVSYNFSFITTDYEQDDVYYFIDWGDNTNSGWFGPYASGSTVEKNHIYSKTGIYYIKAKSKDTKGYGGFWSNPYKIMIGNFAPEKPQISGPNTGKIRTKIEFTIFSTDPNSDSLYYTIKWGDGIIEDWFGPYNSGIEIIKSHKWSKEGSYKIQAKVKDIDGLESGWGTFEVTIPKTRTLYNFIWMYLLERFPLLYKIINSLSLYLES